MPPVPKDEAERNKKSLAVILKQPGNKECADCTAKGPTWCPTNWGVFVCIKCAGIHRKMGTHISKVKSCTLDSWYDREVELVKLVGNKMGKDIYEESLGKPKPDENDDIVKIEDFIRNKYERRLWMRSGAEEGCIYVAKMLKSNPDALANKQEEVSTPVEEVKQAVQKPKPVPTQTTTPVKKPAAAAKKPVQKDDGPSLLDFDAANSQSSLEVLVSSTPSTKPTNNLTPVQQQTFQQQPQHHQQPASKDAIMNMFNTPAAAPQPMGYQQPMYGQQQYPPQGRGFVPMGHQQHPPMYPPQQQHHMYPPQGRGFAPMGHQQHPPMYPPQQQQHMYPPQGRGFAPMAQQPMYPPQYPNPAFRGTQQYGYK